MDPLTQEQIDEILVRLRLNKGAEAMTASQLRRRIQAFTQAAWPWTARNQYPDQYQSWAEAHSPAIVAAQEAFVFNRRLAAYRRAIRRLSRKPGQTPQDDKQRAEAEAIIKNTPQEVKDFDD